MAREMKVNEHASESPEVCTGKVPVRLREVPGVQEQQRSNYRWSGDALRDVFPPQWRLNHESMLAKETSGVKVFNGSVSRCNVQNQ
jgi:hypothetical protein